MFDYFKGVITYKKKTAKGAFVTIETAGAGYMLEVTEKDFRNAGNDVEKMYVTLLHREDSMTLYGFSSRETRDIFQILLSVSGVGAKMAIALLNEFDICDLISFVIEGNYKELTLAKGVGTKLAQKIILELKDKLIKIDFPQAARTVKQTPAIEDAQSVLLSLGYENKEIETVMVKILPCVENNSDPEEVLRKALTCLSSL